MEKNRSSPSTKNTWRKKTQFPRTVKNSITIMMLSTVWHENNFALREPTSSTNYHKLFNEQRGFVERKLYSRILS